jgi:hypothetical protein
LGSQVRYTCFRFQGTPFCVDLDTESGSICCVIRGIPLAVRPEEIVRQTLLVFLTTHLQELYPKTIDLTVEQESLDVAIYVKPEDEAFSPDVPPALIIETKRRDVVPLDSDWNETQLIDYLRLKRCATGILFNCGEAYLYDISAENVSKTILTDLSEAVYAITRAVHQQQDALAKQRADFVAATHGDYSSFQKLVELYGRSSNSTFRFVYEQDNVPAYVSAFLFRIEGNIMRFRTRGYYSRKPPELTEKTFRKLISIGRLSKSV